MTEDIDLPAKVLIVAGSDSSGGAGIQADIKTCAALGAYSATAVTAVTVQNTTEVSRVELMPPDLVAAQIEAVMSDIGADVVKIGMLGNAAIITAVADALETHAPDALFVLDPVMVATSGDRLLDADAVEVLKNRLLPRADVITPNVPEAALLTGLEVNDVDGLIAAGEALRGAGAFAALMKGGHLEGQMVFDVLVGPEGTATYTAPRLRSRHTHGTGCTLASALAAGLALGMPMEDAVLQCREFVFEAIRTAPKLGRGNGPLNHGLVLPDSADHVPDNPFAALKSLKE